MTIVRIIVFGTIPFVLINEDWFHNFPSSNFSLVYQVINVGFYILQASQAWMEWLMKKRKAFYQRGDMATAAWAEQQQRELNIRARSLSRSKVLDFTWKLSQLSLGLINCS